MRQGTKTPVLQTGRLTITPLDLPHLLLCAESWQEMEAALGLQATRFGLARSTRRAITAKVRRMRRDPLNYAWHTYWLIILKAENQAVGLVGFKGAPNKQGEVEIGYNLQLHHRGQGYMTEAARAIIQWAAVERPGLCVKAETSKSNVPSQRVLRRIGFEKFRETVTAYWWRWCAE